MKYVLAAGVTIKAMGLPQCLLAVSLVLTAVEIAAAGPIVFINEIHYDNTGADLNEFIEIAGPAGTDLNGWELALYNGATGETYGSKSLSSTLTDQSNGFGFTTLYYPTSLQNGPSDAVALIDSFSTVIQFLSYEGTLTALNGPASGMTSTDIGVSENGSTKIGDSLQLTGIGSTYDHFSWAASSPNTAGNLNSAQKFIPDPIPEPATMLLFGSGLAVLAGKRFRMPKKRHPQKKT